jgi:hypothetical protein
MCMFAVWFLRLRSETQPAKTQSSKARSNHSLKRPPSESETVTLSSKKKLPHHKIQQVVRKYHRKLFVRFFIAKWLFRSWTVNIFFCLDSGYLLFWLASKPYCLAHGVCDKKQDTTLVGSGLTFLSKLQFMKIFSFNFFFIWNDNVLKWSARNTNKASTHVP